MPDKPETKATKPPLRRVPSDDCEVVVGGVTYYPHRGESLWFRGRQKIGQLRADWAFRRVGAELDEVAPDPKVEGETDEVFLARVAKSHLEGVRITDQHYADIVAWIAKRLVAWDWTDDDGNPLPNLDGTADPFAGISDDEMFYIWRTLRGEGPAEVGEDAGASPPTSSVTA